MNHVIYNSIVNFIWGIANDVLCDVYVRGKYRDVILPMTVIRPLYVLLEKNRKFNGGYPGCEARELRGRRDRCGESLWLGP